MIPIWAIKPLIGAAIVLAAGAAVLWYGSSRYNAGEAAEKTRWQASMAEGEKRAAEDTDELARHAKRAGAAQLDVMIAKLEQSNREKDVLRKVLANTGSCTVPAAALRVLDGLPADPPRAESPGPAGIAPAPAVAEDSTLAAQLEICRQNNRIAEINDAGLIELKRLYDEVKRTVNEWNARKVGPE